MVSTRNENVGVEWCKVYEEHYRMMGNLADIYERIYDLENMFVILIASQRSKTDSFPVTSVIGECVDMDNSDEFNGPSYTSSYPNEQNITTEKSSLETLTNDVVLHYNVQEVCKDQSFSVTSSKAKDLIEKTQNIMKDEQTTAFGFVSTIMDEKPHQMTHTDPGLTQTHPIETTLKYQEKQMINDDNPLALISVWQTVEEDSKQFLEPHDFFSVNDFDLQNHKGPPKTKPRKIRGGASFKKDASLDVNKYIRFVKNSTKQFECNACVFTTHKKGILKEHIKCVHLKMKDFRCNYCKYATKTMTGLKTHITGVHTKDKDFQCDKCSYKTSYKQNLIVHIKSVHIGTKDFHCKHCSFTALHSNSLAFHTKRHHGKITDMYECAKCEYVTPSKSVLKQHHKEVHPIDNSLCLV